MYEANPEDPLNWLAGYLLNSTQTDSNRKEMDSRSRRVAQLKAMEKSKADKAAQNATIKRYEDQMAGS